MNTKLANELEGIEAAIRAACDDMNRSDTLSAETWEKVRRAYYVMKDIVDAGQESTFDEACNVVCRDLPAGWQVRVELERHAGSVELTNPSGDVCSLPESDTLAEELKEAVAFATKKPQSKCELCGAMFDGAGTICSRECVDREVEHSKCRENDI